MPLLEHLVELRRRLLWSAVAFAVCFALCYYFSREIYSFLVQPLANILEHRGANRRMIYTQLYEAFFTYLRVAAFGAAFISFPVVASQVYMFVAPGLYRSEKRAIVPFLVATPVLFVLGAALAYYFIFPAAWSFFLSFETPTGAGGLPIELEAKVSEYLSLVMKLIFAFGIAFQLPVSAEPVGQGRDRVVGRAEEIPALRVCRHVHHRRHHHAAGHHHADRVGGAADHPCTKFPSNVREGAGAQAGRDLSHA